jgi:hypothetical protein
VHTPDRRTLIAISCALLIGASAMCSPESLVSNTPLPPNVPDPGSTENPAGALASYYGTLSLFNLAFAGKSFGGQNSAVVVSGMLSDELIAKENGGPSGVTDDQMPIDSRSLPEYSSTQLQLPGSGAAITFVTFGQLSSVRGQANEARGLLTDFGTPNMKALIGHLYAIQGETETLLADMFCSGIPLSTVDYNGNYTLAAGSSTQDVYQHAIALYDSALALSGDSMRFINLASVGKGRALLATGDYAGAASAVAAVPDGFSYVEDYPPPGVGTSGTNGTQATPSFAEVNLAVGGWEVSVSDKEGTNGLDFRTSGDPRTASSEAGVNTHGQTLYHPNKYSSDGSGPIVLADWQEARLIEAEAALKVGDLPTWLGKLNHIREAANDPALPDLTDPGTDDARIDLTFRERAFWLYLTGHRQGDLRRLVRQYGRSETEVFPVGAYRGAHGSYGNDVTIPIPAQERDANTKFTGCINRGS